MPAQTLRRFGRVASGKGFPLSIALERYKEDRRPGNQRGYQPLARTTVLNLDTAVKHLRAFLRDDGSTACLEVVTPAEGPPGQGRVLPRREDGTWLWADVRQDHRKRTWLYATYLFLGVMLVVLRVGLRAAKTAVVSVPTFLACAAIVLSIEQFHLVAAQPDLNGDGVFTIRDFLGSAGLVIFAVGE